MIDNNNWIAILCITLMACIALVVLKADGKEVVIAAISGVIGFLSNSVVPRIADRRKTDGTQTDQGAEKP